MYDNNIQLSAQMISWLADNHVNILQGTVQSQGDLNPIEHLWEMIGEKITEHNL